MLKIAQEKIAEPLQIIFSKSLRQGIARIIQLENNLNESL
jgi:hypothetical protein